ncbi:hypothetical protein ACHAWT_004090 [Skeletonema menzelii]
MPYQRYLHLQSELHGTHSNLTFLCPSCLLL